MNVDYLFISIKYNLFIIFIKIIKKNLTFAKLNTDVSFNFVKHIIIASNNYYFYINHVKTGY